MTSGPFTVDVERALDALDLAWGDEYDEIWISDGKWNAHHKDAEDDDVLTGVTPDELNRLIRGRLDATAEPSRHRRRQVTDIRTPHLPSGGRTRLLLSLPGRLLSASACAAMAARMAASRFARSMRVAASSAVSRAITAPTAGTSASARSTCSHSVDAAGIADRHPAMIRLAWSLRAQTAWRLIPGSGAFTCAPQWTSVFRMFWICGAAAVAASRNPRRRHTSRCQTRRPIGGNGNTARVWAIQAAIDPVQSAVSIATRENRLYNSSIIFMDRDDILSLHVVTNLPLPSDTWPTSPQYSDEPPF